MPYNLNELSPAASYTPPEYPTLAQAGTDNTLLKKLPSRWQHNAAVVACAGMLAMTTLAGLVGCSDNAYIRPHHGGEGGAPQYTVYPTESETPFVYPPPVSDNGLDVAPEDNEVLFVYPPLAPDSGLNIAPEDLDIHVRIHQGGAGAGPNYVVYLTEQEALGIIYRMLTAAGLDLSATPPDYTVSTWPDIYITLDFFDQQRGIAVAFHDANVWWESIQREVVINYFTALNPDLTFWAFQNPGARFGWRPSWGTRPENNQEPQEPTDEGKLAAAEEALNRLAVQVNEFIDFLRAEGIL